MEVYIPSRRYQQKPHSQSWFSPECAAAICQRNFFFHKYQRDRTVESLSLFKTARRRCKKTLDLARDRCAKQTRASISSRKLVSRDFWRICKCCREESRHFHHCLNSDTMAVSSADKAELLCHEFAKNSSLDDGDRPLPTFPPRTDSTLSPLFISVKQIRRIINSLDTSKSSGPDGIPAVVLKVCAPELSPILVKLYRKCLSVGEFSSSWKIAYVVPVAKKECDSYQPSSYRSISLLPARCLDLQSIHVLDYLETKQLLSDTQFGFRHSRSTADLLAYVTEQVSRAIENQGVTRSVALDISGFR